jgi:hypothetical protein
LPAEPTHLAVKFFVLGGSDQTFAPDEFNRIAVRNIPIVEASDAVADGTVIEIRP